MTPKPQTPVRIPYDAGAGPGPEFALALAPVHCADLLDQLLGALARIEDDFAHRLGHGSLPTVVTS